MRARTVTAPDGRVWQVSYRWLHRKARWFGPKRDTVEGLWLGTEVSGELAQAPGVGGFFLVIAILLLLVLLLLLVFPALVFAIDVLIVVVVAGFGIAIRVLRRHPWVVEAESRGSYRERREWLVVGWRESGKAIDAIASALERGVQLERIEPSNQVTPR